MTDRTPAVARPGDGTEVLHGAGDHYTFRLTGDDTDGQYFTMEGVVPPGGGRHPTFRRERKNRSTSWKARSRSGLTASASQALPVVGSTFRRASSKT